MPNFPREILHVDDDPQVTRLVGKLLGERGFAVAALHDPSKAIDELVRSQRRLVLLDIDMPGTNGLKLLRDIKAFDGGLQVIMLSGLVNLTTVLQSLRWGAEACFFKPLDSVEPLTAAIEDTFAKIDRWWLTLEELSKRRHEEESPTVRTSSEPAGQLVAC